MPSDTETSTAGGQVRKFALRYWVAIAVVVVAAIFIAQNRQTARVNVLWIRPEAPMWVLLTVIFGAGILVGLLLGRRRKNRA